MPAIAMSPDVKVRLGIMMFLQYAFNGIWIIPLGTYLNEVGYKGGQIGAIYSMSAIGAIIAPFFIGMIADRFFSAQKILGILNIVGS
ncbi:MAG: MFS transporter, partial [Candidatus Sumerlaeota bacterium]|nr:MFS transporter [Candidatus Sumerlaeota bacterium]